MDCSFLFGSQSITRLICAAIAYIGFTKFQKVECVGVKESPAGEVVVSPQSVLAADSLVSDIEVTENGAKDIDNCRREGNVAFNSTTVGGKSALERLHADEVAAIQANRAHGTARELNDQTALEFIQMIFNEHLPRKEFWLCWFRNRLLSLTEPSETSSSPTAAPSGNDELDSPTGSSAGRNVRGAQYNDTADKRSGVSQDANGSSIAKSSQDICRLSKVWQFTKGLYAFAKSMLFRDTTETNVPRRSIKRALADCGRAVAGKVGRGVVSAVSTVSSVLGYNDTPFQNMKHIIMHLFSPESEVKEGPEEPAHAALDEECFLEKMARLNAFYQLEIANTPIYADRRSFYGPVPKTLHVANAEAPFETARCRSAAHYVVVSSGKFASLSLYTLFAVMLLI
ncbi:membrane protein, putative [Babesia bigemina]|uniref:Membrane protein, putative n=1 Tax=Babesia bigemina TaxID=5866 RepID=A0A061DEG0_BABBI|nr:membrane protein, putative [Babesia bigemina]CDR97215.1 membrane protein, putative [Babesia bigemina]|eukprot:XP_012769401.1 membrane protein, putative [Babesia bigemina]